MLLWPRQSDYPVISLSTGQSVGYPEYESQSAPFGILGTRGALTIVCMTVCDTTKIIGTPHQSRPYIQTIPPSRSRCYCIVPDI